MHKYAKMMNIILAVLLILVYIKKIFGINIPKT